MQDINYVNAWRPLKTGIQKLLFSINEYYVATIILEETFESRVL